MKNFKNKNFQNNQTQQESEVELEKNEEVRRFVDPTATPKTEDGNLVFPVYKDSKDQSKQNEETSSEADKDFDKKLNNAPVPVQDLSAQGYSGDLANQQNDEFKDKVAKVLQKHAYATNQGNFQQIHKIFAKGEYIEDPEIIKALKEQGAPIQIYKKDQ